MLVREALGATLLCVGALAISAWRGTSRLDQRPATVVACALSVGIVALFAISVLGRTSRTMLSDACADTTSGGGMKIGAVLAAQTIGILIGVALPRCGGHDLVAVADRSS